MIAIALAAGLFSSCFASDGAQVSPHSVKASSGPVELSLSLLRTRLAVREKTETAYDWDRIADDFPTDPPSPKDLQRYAFPRVVRVGEPVWFKLTIKNIGSRPITVFSDIFWEHADFRKALEAGQDSGRGVFFIVTGPDGKPMKRRESVYPHVCSGLDEKRNPFVGPPEDPAEQAEAKRLISNWEKKGYSRKKIGELLNERLRNQEEAQRAAFARAHPRKILQPGQWISTRPWAFDGFCHDEKAVPIGDFAELWVFDFVRPGRYEVQAVYNEATGSALRRRPEDVYFRTPPIVVEVGQR